MNAALQPFLANIQSRDLLRQLSAGASEPDFSRKPTLYVGFDPSASSLHAGSLVPLTTMDRWRRRGGQLIVLLGGATGLVGDPSGKDQERTIEAKEVVAERVQAIGRQIKAFFERTDGPEPIYVNNADWYRDMNVLDFLRDVGKSFSVNQMLVRDSVRERLQNRDQGISYTEFSYQLLQAYDFVHLFRAYGCSWQMGASDQWGNIVSGADLIRRMTGEVAYGLTLPLLTNSEGKKYGKSEKGTVWLDPELTSPYAFYQFWFNSLDADVGRFLTWLSDFSLDEIEGFRSHDPALRVPQKELALALTTRLHGEEVARLARDASEVLFSDRYDKLDAKVADMLAGVVSRVDLERERSHLLVEILVRAGAARSKGEGRRLIEQKAVSLNGEVVSDPQAQLAGRMLRNGLGVLSVGKQRRYVIRESEGGTQLNYDAATGAVSLGTEE